MTNTPLRLPAVCMCMVLFLAVVLGRAPVRAQSTSDTQPPSSLRVFLDCAARCDDEHVRREITIVDYVRDRQDADVHVLISSQATGSGGVEYTLQFIGAAAFSATDQTLRFAAPESATDDERRTGLVETLKRGLVRYLSLTSLAERVRITFDEGVAQRDAPRGADDPWNLWVFRTSFTGTFTGESSDRGRSIRLGSSASRTSEEWRLGGGATFNYRDDVFELSDHETFRSISRGFDLNALAVKSLSDRWSLGVIATAGSSTFLNYDLRARVAAGIEHNIFPYSESTRRLLTLQYTVGLNSFDYREETVFGKLAERLIDHRTGILFTLLEPWGSAGMEVTFSQFLKQPDKYNLSALGQTTVRVSRGFSFNTVVTVSRTQDQLYLPVGDVTVEEILVRERQRATAYRYSMVVGVSYSFGSIFNNIVNPRFGRSAEDASE